MAEENRFPGTVFFDKLVRDASKLLNDAADAKRLNHRYEAMECLRRALEQIGLAFLHA